MYILVNNFNFKLDLFLPLYLLLILGCTELAVLVFDSLLIYLHGREGILKRGDLLLLLRRICHERRLVRTRTLPSSLDISGARNGTR